MATNFSPCKGSYILNQFPGNVMFGMNGFQISASGAIQGHHGPLVPNSMANNSGFPGLICSTIKFIQDLMGRYIVAKIGTDWSIFADARV